jgi:hypothetical protein
LDAECLRRQAIEASLEALKESVLTQTNTDSVAALRQDLMQEIDRRLEDRGGFEVERTPVKDPDADIIFLSNPGSAEKERQLELRLAAKKRKV